MDIDHKTLLSLRMSHCVKRMIWAFFLVLVFTVSFFGLQANKAPSPMHAKPEQLKTDALFIKEKLYQGIDEILQQKHLTELASQHENILQLQQQLNSISRSASLEKAIKDTKSYKEIVLSIAQNLPTNMGFLQESQAQVQLTLDHLELILVELLAQKSLLGERIYSGKDKASHTSLIQAYMELSVQQENYQTVKRSLVNFSELLHVLSPFYDLSDFDVNISKIKSDLRNWEEQHPYLLKITTPFTDQYEILSLSVHAIDSGINKWRTSLQNTQTYFSFLQEEKQRLWDTKIALSPAVLMSQTSENKNVFRTSVDTSIALFNKVLSENDVAWKGQLIQLPPFFVLAILLFLIAYNLFLLVFYAVKYHSLVTCLAKEKATPEEKSEAKEKEDIEVIDISPSLDEENLKNQQYIDTLTQENNTLKMSMITAEAFTQKLQLSIDEKTALISTLEKNHVELTAASKETLAEVNNSHRQLIEKNKQLIVRTLLQSQSASIKTGGSGLQVYRQLIRMFDWCNQLNTPLKNHTSLVQLYPELSVAIYNIMLEAQWQRNNVFLDVGVEHSNINVNASLFQRMLVYISRLLLLEQFKSSLTVHVSNDNQGNNEEHYLTFEFSVISDKNRKKIPLLVQEFINVQAGKSEARSEAVIYIYKLLAALGVTEFSLLPNDQGYRFVLDFPVNEPCKGLTPQKEAYKASLIGLTVEPELIENIQKQASLISASLSIVGSAKAAEEKALLVDDNMPVIFLLAEDCYENNLESLNDFISQQTTPERYKIMVLQSNYHSPMQRQGLFNQASSPIFSDVFERELQALLAGEQQTNLSIPAEVMSQYQYQTTQVEVLLASDKASTHQTLIRVLHWLGLQVSVVSNVDAMQRYWKSGRYLILISDLLYNPFVELSAGKSIKRGVFTLEPSIEENELLSQIQSWSSQCEESKHWLVEKLALLPDIEQLVSQLSPWLKSKELEFDHNVQAKVESTDAKEVTEATEKTLVTETVYAQDTSVSFDLSQFAINQGTPELAAYMLDEYLSELSSFHLALIESVKEDNVEHSMSLVRSIKLIALIMAAQPLQNVCEQLNVVLNANDKNKLPELLILLSSALDELSSFCEAI